MWAKEDQNKACFDRHNRELLVVAGVWVDGMDALSVKSATAFAKNYVLENGPLMLEMVNLLLTICPPVNASCRDYISSLSQLVALSSTAEESKSHVSSYAGHLQISWPLNLRPRQHIQDQR